MVLKAFVKLIKISAPAPNPDYEIRILFRVPLRIDKPVTVDGIELQLVPAKFDVFLHEHSDLLYTYIIPQNGIVYFDCERATVDDIR